MESEKFHYCFTKKRPESLVMLKDINLMPRLILSDPEKYIYLWVGGSHDEDLMNAKKVIELNLEIKFYYFQTISSAKHQLQGERPQQAVIVAIGSFVRDANELKQIKKIKQIFFYWKEESTIKLPNLYTDKVQLIKKLALLNQKSRLPKILPNFVFMSEGNQIKKSQTLVRTMYSLLNQQIDKNTQMQIIYYFKRLIQLITAQKNQEIATIQILSFFQSLKNGMKTTKQIIKWYTDNTFVYKVINNLLRAHRDPTEIFFIQPYFKLLFRQIKSLYSQRSKQLSKQGKEWDFICYRGGKITPEQFMQFKKNQQEGSITQNLGFLSTTLKKQVAQRFKLFGNVIFQICVKQGKVGKSEFGFAEIKNFSQFYEEQQIIFNPLNAFQILSAQSLANDQYYIKLQYSEFNQMGEGQDSKSKWNMIKRIQKQERFQNCCQGNALVNQFYIFPEGELYWKKYLELIEDSSQSLNVFGTFKKAFCLFNISYYNSKKNKAKKRFQWFYILKDLLGDKDVLFKKLELQIGESYQQIKNWDEVKKDKMKNKSNLKNSQYAQLIEMPEYNFFSCLTFSDSLFVQRKKFVINQQVDLSNMKEDYKQILQLELKGLEKELQHIKLNNNQIVQFPLRILQFPNLKNVQIKNNKIHWISSKIQNLVHLREFDASFNSIEALPDQFFTLPKIEILNLSDNRIKIIGMLGLQNLRELRLNNNKLQSIQNISELKKLKVLDLKNNFLRSLPIGIQKLLSLQKIDVSNNRLFELDEGLGKLRKLKELKFSRNQIEKFPIFIKDLASLQVIELNRNRFHLPKYMLSILSKKNIQDIRLVLRNLVPGSLQKNEKLLMQENMSTPKQKAKLLMQENMSTPKQKAKLLMQENMSTPKQKAKLLMQENMSTPKQKAKLLMQENMSTPKQKAKLLMQENMSTPKQKAKLLMQENMSTPKEQQLISEKF